MSQTRCGLQVNRDNSITKDFHNHPRKKQIGCLISGTIRETGESMLTSDVVEEELEDIQKIAKTEKMDVAELSLGKLTKGVEALLPTDQKGKGIRSTLQNLANILPVKKIGESLAASISNIFPDSDENARDIFPGEHHAIVKLPNGKFGRASYTGPGTHIIQRLKREPGGDPPRVLSDKVSQAHDIRYGLAKGVDDVRKADMKMLSSLSDLRRDKLDRDVNIIPAMVGIRGKVVAENFDLLSRDKFIDPNFKPSARDIRLMEGKLKQLEQQGFGFRDKPFKARKGKKFSAEIIRRLQAPPPSRIKALSTDLSTRDRTEPIGTAFPREKKIGVFTGPSFDTGPGTTATQSLVGLYGKSNQKGVDLDRRGHRSLETVLSTQGPNTRGEFRNRLSGVSQTGSGQHPGMSSSSGHQMVDVKTTPSKIERSPREQKRLGQQEGGKGYPGVSPVHVQTGSGLPGNRLLKKMRKKVANKKQIYMNEKDMARVLANKLVPLVR